MSKQPGQSSVSRRSLLKSGAGVVGAGTLAGWVGSGAITPAPTQQFDDAAIAAEPAGNNEIADSR
jgi:hypothetical protein